MTARARTRTAVGLLSFIWALGALGARAGAQTAPHPLGLNDVLALEDIGRVRFAMHDRMLLFERMPPYGEAPNIDALESTVDRSMLAKVYAMDPQGLDEAHLLFEQEPDRSCWLGALSPDSTRVAMYCLWKGRLSAAVYDLATKRLWQFKFLPNYAERWTQSPVWISNDELVYPALPESEPQAAAFRSSIAARVNALWSASLSGKEASITVVHSRADGFGDVLRARPGSLMRIDLRSGTETAIGTGYFYNLRLAPNGRFLAALREGGGAIQPELNAGPIGVEATYRELVVFDLQTGAATMPCDRCHISLGTLNWSVDGTRLTFVARSVGEPPRRADLWSYEPPRHVLTKVVLAGLRLACGGTRSPMIRSVGVGDGVAVFATPVASGAKAPLDFSSCHSDARADWRLISLGHAPQIMTPGLEGLSADLVGTIPGSLFVLATGGVWQISPTAPPRNITAGVKSTLTSWSVGRAPAMERSREDLFTSSRIPNRFTVLESESEIVSVDLFRGTYRSLVRPSPGSELLDVTSDGGMGVFRESNDDGMRIILVRPENHRVLLHLNAHLANVIPAKKATIEYAAAKNGETISSCMLLPPDWKPGHRYPLVVDVYPAIPSGGCTDASELRFDPLDLRLLAAHGYIVLAPATPDALIRTAEGPMRGLTPVVLAAVDAAEAAGYVDPERVGLYGFSQGYTAALQILTETRKFRAAIIGFGIADFASEYGSMPLRNRLGSDGVRVGDFGRYEARSSAMQLDARPWDDAQRFTSNSPLFNAEKIETPLLIANSDFDVFPFEQSAEIFGALYRLRKEATYVTYWGEGHGPLSPANVTDWWSRMFAWFDTRLRPGG